MLEDSKVHSSGEQAVEKRVLQRPNGVFEESGLGLLSPGGDS